eukprot:gene8168-5883_t
MAEVTVVRTFTNEDLMLPLGQPSPSPRPYDALDSHRSSNQAESVSDGGDDDEEAAKKSTTSEPISYAVAAEKFRDLFHSSAASKALERVRKELKTNPYMNSQLIRFVTEGSTAFNTHLLNYWNTTSIIAVFLGVVAATIAVGYTGRFAGIVGQNVISADTLRQTGRAFFVLWAVTAAINFTVLVINLMAINQYKLMLHDDDMAWFIITWGFWTITLPWLLLIFGALTAVAGVVVGVVLTSDLLVASVVAGFSGLLVLFAVILWLSMISYNKDKEQEALAAIRRVLLKQA